MRNPSTTKDYRVGCECKAVVAPPARRMTVMIPSNQPPSTWQFLANLVPSFGFANEHITHMDDCVFGSDGVLAISNDEVGECLGAVAVCCDLRMVKNACR